MKETKEVKVKFSTAICIILIILLIVGCGLLYYFGFVQKGKKIKSLEEKNLQVQAEKTQVETKIEELEKQISNTRTSEERENVDNEMMQLTNESNGNIVYTYYEAFNGGPSYYVPKININSEDAKKINKENEEMIEEIKKGLEIYKESGDVGFDLRHVDYRYFINGDVLSLVIAKTSEYYTKYEVYNLSISTGKQLKNEELLKTKQITVEEFENNLPKVFGEFFEEYYKQMDKEDEFYKEQYNRTIAKENCTINNQIFLGEEGEINVIGTIYALAGGNAYAHIIRYK